MIENSLQIFGPPGCGKTETLMRRIEEALKAGVSPERIAFVSFSRKAVQEAKERASARFNLGPRQLVHFRTLHSTGFRGLALRKEDVMTPRDYAAVGKLVGEDFKDNSNPDEGVLLPTTPGLGNKYLQIIDRARYRKLPLEEEWKYHDTFDMYLFKAKQIAEQLEEYKAKMHKMDYVDMIERYIEMAETPNLDLLIIDEAQDLTPLQWDMVKAMAETSDRVLIAGDDDQAIHRWTGVDVKQFINMSPEREVLTQSYRLPRRIYDLGQRVAHRIRGRVPKLYHPREEEGLVKWHFDLGSVPLRHGSWTIMARTNFFVNELAKEVRERGYYYSVKGRAPLSKGQAQAINTWNRLRSDLSVSIHEVRNLYEQVPKQGDKAVVKRGSLKLLDAFSEDAHVYYETLEKEAGLLPGAIERDAFDALNLGGDMRRYLSHVMKSGEDITKPPRIKLSTFHAMKGGEDDNCVVFLGTSQQCEESGYPEDEHRAFYVGITRAREALHIVEGNKKRTYQL